MARKEGRRGEEIEEGHVEVEEGRNRQRGEGGEGEGREE